jgi:hypothetical protein
MTDSYLHLIPDDAAWVPDEVAVRRAVRVLRAVLPGAGKVSAAVHPQPVFIRGSRPLAEIACPACGSRPGEAWWSDRVQRATAGGFARLSVRTPCCDTATSLNELAVSASAGFARFQLTAEDPGRERLTPQELDRVAAALGRPLREVHQRN